MTDLCSFKSLPGRTSNGHISATNHPIHFRFGFRVGLSGSVNITVPFIFRPNWDKMGFCSASVKDMSRIFSCRCSNSNTVVVLVVVVYCARRAWSIRNTLDWLQSKAFLVLLLLLCGGFANVQLSRSLQEDTTVRSRFKPTFQCTSCCRSVRNDSLRKIIPHCKQAITKACLEKLRNVAVFRCLAADLWTSGYSASLMVAILLLLIVSDQLWDLIGDHLSDRFPIANQRLIIHQISHQVDGRILADQVRQLMIKQGDLQFIAYLHQKHRFTLPVRSAIHALK